MDEIFYILQFHIHFDGQFAIHVCPISHLKKTKQFDKFQTNASGEPAHTPVPW
jgi:hypothetical protein